MIQKKILLVGDFGVGKSSLVERWVHNRFSENYHSTIGVVISKKEITVNDVELKFLIWDVAGSREISDVPKAYYLGCSGILYIFDLTRPETWENLAERLNVVRELSNCENLLVIANKSDLCNSEQIKEVLANVNIAVDIVTSAKDDSNVEAAFQQLGINIVKKIAG